jgi:hypothetical protein
MEIYTQQESNYLHVQIGGKFSQMDWDGVEELVKNEDDRQTWLIMAIDDNSSIRDMELWHAVVELNAFCLENQGLLVLTGSNKELVDLCEKLGLIILPTLDEAIDYVFMEQLEKDLGQDE